MSRQSPVITIQEIPGTKFPDLAAAQRQSLLETASDLAATIRSLLASGKLIIQDGKIISNQKEKGQ